MSIFSRLFGTADNTAAEAELAAAQDRIQELENQEPQVIEVPVPQEMVSVVAVQFAHKSTSITAAEYSAYVGIPVKEFVSQMFSSADLNNISQISLVSTQGTTAVLGMDDIMPETTPATVGISQTSGNHE